MMTSLTPLLADLVVVGAFVTFLIALFRRILKSRAGSLSNT